MELTHFETEKKRQTSGPEFEITRSEPMAQGTTGPIIMAPYRLGPFKISPLILRSSLLAWIFRGPAILSTYKFVKKWFGPRKKNSETEALLLMPPIDSYVLENLKAHSSGHFHEHYREWRMRRTQKILQIFGSNWTGKRILEIGAGHCEIGAFFAELGAEVTCLEGRIQNVLFSRLKHRKLEKLKIEHADLYSDFSHLGSFDLIIVFGLIEALDERFMDVLRCTFKMSNHIVLETMICDSDDPGHYQIYLHDAHESDSSLTGRGVMPSGPLVEKIYRLNGFQVHRHFASDLNTHFHCYDWKTQNTGRCVSGLRRFWHFSKL